MYTLDRRQEVTSTNDICMEQGRQKRPGNYVCIARCQTKGRGRQGRDWFSQKDTGIYMSFLERPDCRIDLAPQLSLVMGLAAVKAIEETTGLKASLKWPNDLVIEGRKLSGILAQMQLEHNKIDYIVVGIGINLFQESFPDDLCHATSILLEYKKQGRILGENRDTFREKIENAIVKWWETYYNQIIRANSFEGIKEEYEACLANLGKDVMVLDPQGEFRATCLGISKDGALLVERQNHTIEEIRSGEVSVRGIYGYIYRGRIHEAYEVR